MDLKKDFGTLIRSKRMALGLSQEVLAERANLHRTYVTDIERGSRNLTLESISKLAGALGVTIRDLFPTEIFGGGAPEPPPAASPANPVDLLLVEDSAKDVELTLAAFKEARLTNRIHVERDGVAALDYLFCRGEYRDRLMANQPEAMLLDLGLPKVHGLEVLREIMQHEATRKIKVVVLSASRRDEDVREAMRLGAVAYIVKPVDFFSFSQVAPKLDFWWALLRANRPVGHVAVAKATQPR